MNNRREVIDILNLLEEKYDVDGWIIDNVHIWPIVKFHLFSKWRSIQNKEYNSLLDSPTKDESFIKTTVKRLLSAFHLTKLLIKRKQQVDFLFLGANSHRVIHEGVFINRYFQPFNEELGLNGGRSINIEYQPKDISKLYSDTDETIFLDKYYFAARVMARFRSKPTRVNLKNFDEFIDEVNSYFPKLINANTYVNLVKKKVSVIKTYSYLFDIFFEKYCPKNAMSLCYYSNICYGMNYAAYSRNVTSIDMQHGGQGVLHPAYSNFNKTPVEGFNLLPKIFWCWDKPSLNVIKQWVDKQRFHQVILGGNPWLSYFFSKNTSNFEFPKSKIILYTLQLNEPEDYIIQAIKDSPSEFQWWLRMHPRTLSTKPHLEDVLRREGVLDKVEIEKATRYPLPQILRQAYIHISRSSGSVIEAAQLGVKTIIINEIGVENYADYIENKDAIGFLNATSDDLLNIIFDVKNASIIGSNVVDSRTVLRELWNGNILP